MRNDKALCFGRAFYEGVKNSVSMDEKSLLTGTRYVEICCRTKLILSCRISFLVIVLPVYPFLYTYFKIFAHQSGISRKKNPILDCGRQYSIMKLPGTWFYFRCGAYSDERDRSGGT